MNWKSDLRISAEQGLINETEFKRVLWLTTDITSLSLTGVWPLVARFADRIRALSKKSRPAKATESISFWYYFLLRKRNQKFHPSYERSLVVFLLFPITISHTKKTTFWRIQNRFVDFFPLSSCLHFLRFCFIWNSCTVHAIRWATTRQRRRPVVVRNSRLRLGRICYIFGGREGAGQSQEEEISLTVVCSGAMAIKKDEN